MHEYIEKLNIQAFKKFAPMTTKFILYIISPLFRHATRATEGHRGNKKLIRDKLCFLISNQFVYKFW